MTVSGCSPGNLKLSVLANSVFGNIAGPQSEFQTSEVVIERVAPSVTVTRQAATTAATVMNYALAFSEPISGLTASDFTISGDGCVIDTVSGFLASYSLVVSGCSNNAIVQLALPANTVFDMAGNSGPESSPSIGAVSIDRTPPVGSWPESLTTTSGDPQFSLNFTESVTGIESADFSQIGEASGCSLAVSETVSRLQFVITATGCSLGTVQVIMGIGSYFDLLGNSGPTRLTASSIITKQPVPAPPFPEPVSETVSEPSSNPSASPLPSASPGVTSATSFQVNRDEIVLSSPAAGRYEISLPVVIDPVAGEQVVQNKRVLQKTYSFSAPLEQETYFEDASDLDFIESDSQITVVNPTDPKPILAPGLNWLNLASMGFGGLAAIFAGIGAVKAVRQMRTRRLVRKFA